MSITSSEIESLLAQQFSDASIAASGDNGSYQVQIISDVFEGLNAVKRQQAVYRVLNPHITSGVIHAINMQLLTTGEQAAGN
jgi:acid stress-induced BolA-like protein IbaG/YrbA